MRCLVYRYVVSMSTAPNMRRSFVLRVRSGGNRSTDSSSGSVDISGVTFCAVRQLTYTSSRPGEGTEFSRRSVSTCTEESYAYTAHHDHQNLDSNRCKQEHDEHWHKQNPMRISTSINTSTSAWRMRRGFWRFKPPLNIGNFSGQK